MVLTKEWSVGSLYCGFEKSIPDWRDRYKDIVFPVGAKIRLSRMSAMKKGAENPQIGMSALKEKGCVYHGLFNVTLAQLNEIEYEDMPVAVLD